LHCSVGYSSKELWLKWTGDGDLMPQNFFGAPTNYKVGYLKKKSIDQFDTKWGANSNATVTGKSKLLTQKL